MEHYKGFEIDCKVFPFVVYYPSGSIFCRVDSLTEAKEEVDILVGNKTQKRY